MVQLVQLCGANDYSRVFTTKGKGLLDDFRVMALRQAPHGGETMRQVPVSPFSHVNLAGTSNTFRKV